MEFVTLPVEGLGIPLLSDTKVTTNVPLRLYLNYSPRSHVLTGYPLKEELAGFRQGVLKEQLKATWHPHLRIPEGKGWLVKKELEKELISNMEKHGIIYTTHDVPLEYLTKRPAKPKRRNTAPAVVPVVPVPLPLAEVPAEWPRLEAVEREDLVHHEKFRPHSAILWAPPPPPPSPASQAVSFESDTEEEEERKDDPRIVTMTEAEIHSAVEKQQEEIALRARTFAEWDAMLQASDAKVTSQIYENTQV